MCFNNLRKLLKVAAFVIFPTSIKVLFETHQKFSGHFLKELRDSFNVIENKNVPSSLHFCVVYWKQ